MQRNIEYFLVNMIFFKLICFKAYDVISKVTLLSRYNLYLCPRTMVELWKEKT